MFLFGKKADIDIELSNCENRKNVEFDGKEYPVYYDGETVSGKVNIDVRPGKKLDHQGIVIELVGRIEYLYDRGTSQEFLCLEKDLARHGVLNAGRVAYPFEFRNVRKPYETYRGVNVNLRYIIRVHILQRLTNILREKELEVQTLALYQEPGDGVRMEVGIEDSLHIEFEYSSVRYHLEDVIIGKIYFILVRVKIKHMDLQIIRHETVGRGPTIFAESTYLNKYELMDGSPVRGECVPVRVFLRDVHQLRPSMPEIGGGAFSVRYFLNLVLTDEDDRRYYKQQEILLYRRADKMKQYHEPIATKSQMVQNLVQQGRIKVLGNVASSGDAINNSSEVVCDNVIGGVDGSNGNQDEEKVEEEMTGSSEAVVECESSSTSLLASFQQGQNEQEQSVEEKLNNTMNTSKDDGDEVMTTSNRNIDQSHIEPCVS